MPENVKNGIPYQEPPRHDEMPSGVPGPVHVGAVGERTQGGKWVKGCRTAQSAGGKSRKGKARLTLASGGKSAKALRRALARDIALTVGGGTCGPGASLLLRWAADKAELAEKAKAAGDVEGFRKLTESARMDYVYAKSDAAKDAENRPRTPVDMVAENRRLLLSEP